MDPLKPMTIDEVEKCDYAYLVYEEDDHATHCFLRVKTYDEFISFDRPLNNTYTHSQPHLWKEYYGTTWFAFREPLPQAIINAYRNKIRRRSV